MSPFTQVHATCRCEWGLAGLAALAPADVTIVVDVLSFTTCVDVATARGGAILPYSWSDWDDRSAAAFAKKHNAEWCRLGSGGPTVRCERRWRIGWAPSYVGYPARDRPRQRLLSHSSRPIGRL